MSKLDDSLLSGSRGRTGKLVVANVNGIEILKVRPKKSSKAPSLKQELIRQRMSRCYDFISSYKIYASAHFGTKIGLKSSYNQAMANLLHAFKLDYVQGLINIVYPDILFAKGPLLPPQPTAIRSDAANQITVEWYNNAAGIAERDTDELQLLCAVEGQAVTLFFENQAQRADTTYTITLPPMLSGKTVHLYMAFKAALTSEASTSAYVGTTVVQ